MTNTTTVRTYRFAADAGWQPCRPNLQCGDNTVDHYAVLCGFRVVTEFGNPMHGNWQTEAAARRFARSGGPNWRVEAVEPYWHCSAWGRMNLAPAALVAEVEDAELHARIVR